MKEIGTQCQKQHSWEPFLDALEGQSHMDFGSMLWLGCRHNDIVTLRPQTLPKKKNRCTASVGQRDIKQSAKYIILVHCLHRAEQHIFFFLFVLPQTSGLLPQQCLYRVEQHYFFFSFLLISSFFYMVGVSTTCTDRYSYSYGVIGWLHAAQPGCPHAALCCLVDCLGPVHPRAKGTPEPGWT